MSEHLLLEQGYEEHVARAYINLAIVTLKHRDYAEGTRHFQQGLAYCIDHDLEGWDHMLRAHWARSRVEAVRIAYEQRLIHSLRLGTSAVTHG